MAAVLTRDIVKKFGEVPAVNGISLDGAGRRVHGVARPVGLRQDDVPAHHLRARAADERRPPDRRRHRQRHSAARPRRGDDVPELRPLSAFHGAQQHRLSAEDAARSARRNRQEGRVGVAVARHRPSARPAAAPALGRRTPARRARARAGARADRAAARRAALQSRRQIARLGAPGDQAVPAAGRHHHHLRDPRSGRGDGHGRPHRRHRPRQSCARWERRPKSTTTPPTASSRPSSARRR